ncbi:HET-domain-containing protein [Amniculicola lignicola CBS 123094]|uniref:HET-domain-containing protein n=1 Tax=Amniculicola lignicola CBS 123094 TaxID=1392246 RepID=A0A6A5W5X9_9PLEO|nr:HET-domain-containing protein [Amniculicola lignicola CBS 123094]
MPLEHKTTYRTARLAPVAPRNDSHLSVRKAWNIDPALGFRKSPLLGNRSLHDEEDDLCASCASIDFDVIFRLDPSRVERMGTEVYHFAGLEESMIDSSCALCRLFASFAFTNGLEYTCGETHSGQIYALPSTSLCGLDPRVTEDQRIVCGISLDGRPVSWDPALRCVDNLAGLILRTAEVEPPVITNSFCYGIPLGPEVQGRRLRDMLTRCAKAHPVCRQPTHDFPVRARVIDCKTRRMVDMTEGCRYAALSYVWGAKKRRETFLGLVDEEVDKSYLPHRLPRTIEDAVTIVKKLGLRYLWVDRYCIEQVHSFDKKHQINQMANIYNRAVVTLCALGDHDDLGLPGVSMERNSMATFKANGSSFTACPAPGALQKSLSESVWSTRGWTYQEALLSRRCIFFTEEQIFLVCRASCQSESVSQSSPLQQNTTLWGQMTNIFSTVLDLEVRWSMDDRLKFNDHTQHYQKRHFTLDDDALAAFKGILSVASNQSYYGILRFESPYILPDDGVITAKLPKWRDPDFLIKAGFASGLVWEVERHLSAGTDGHNLRQTVPSWSWVSRRYALPRFTALNATLSSQQNGAGLACFSYPVSDDSFVADIWAEGEGGSLVRIEDLFTTHTTGKVLPELTPYLHLRTLLVHFQYDISTAYSGRGMILFHVGDHIPGYQSYMGGSNMIKFDETDKLVRGHELYFKSSSIKGLAMPLMSMRGPEGLQRWFMLIVQPMPGGPPNTYQRIGIMFLDQDANIVKMYKEHRAEKQVFRLG